MRKKTVCIFAMIVVSMATFAQQGMPLKIGLEIDGRLRKAEANTMYDSPTGVARVGAFAELHLTKRFSGKLNTRLNNTYIHQDEYIANYWGTGETQTFPEISKVTQTLEIGFEPRFYFFPTEESRKVNLYVALPVMFESKSIGKTEYIFRTKLMIVPSLGCRYDFTKHWGIEASGGLGWRKYGKYRYSADSSELEYGVFFGLRYTF
jgi:hypothetical protein